MKKIKDNITEQEFKHLMNYLSADTGIRENRKNRLQKIFSLLYTTGLRLNETSQINETKMTELLTTRKTKVDSYKQKQEKLIYVTDKQIKLLKKYYNDTLGYTVTSERGNKTDTLHTASLIRDVNTYLKKVFSHKNITSHSFRQTLITDLAAKGVNSKIIQTLIGHKSVVTTLRYVKATEQDIMNSLETVR